MTMPATLPLNLYQGDTAAWTFYVWGDLAKTIPADLTGATATAQIRDKPGGTKVIDLACTVTAPNRVDVVLAASAWVETILPAGTWDLQLRWPSTGVVSTIVAGKVTVTADVTEP